MENKALAIKQDNALATFQEIQSMAEAFYKSGMFTDIRQAAQAIVKIQAGRELGLSPVYSMQNINIIRGRLATSANTLAMLVKRSGHYNYRIKEHDDTKCVIAFYEDGQDVGTSSFTMEDAKRADLIKPDSGWAKYPRAMLFSRAISQGARIYCPDAIGGVYTDEELRSIPPRSAEGDIVEGMATEVKIDGVEGKIPAATPTSPVSQPGAKQAVNQTIDATPEQAEEIFRQKPTRNYKTNPDTLKDKTAFQKACAMDFKLTTPGMLCQELNIKTLEEIKDFGMAYRAIAEVRG